MTFCFSCPNCGRTLAEADRADGDVCCPGCREGARASASSCRYTLHTLYLAAVAALVVGGLILWAITKFVLPGDNQAPSVQVIGNNNKTITGNNNVVSP